MTSFSGKAGHLRKGWKRWRAFGAIITGGSMALSRDFKEFIASLNANNVRYLIVGGYAVALHGHPRYTKDMDVWIENTPENASRLVQALADFGFASLELQVSDFIEPDMVIQLGYPPNRIDVLTSLKGVTFTECYERKKEVAFDDVTANFIGLDDLRKNKGATARPQDLADIEELQ